MSIRIRSRCVFQFLEPIENAFLLNCTNIVGHIYIPPRVVVANAVPSVLCCGFVRCAVHDVARDVLATAEGGEEVREVVADAFTGA